MSLNDPLVASVASDGLPERSLYAPDVATADNDGLLVRSPQSPEKLELPAFAIPSANSVLNSIDNLMNTITTELNQSNPIIQPTTEDPQINIPDESSSDEEAVVEEDASVIE